MKTITTFFDFLISSWIWNMTFAFTYPFWAAIIMAFLFRLVVRTTVLRSIILSVTAQLLTVALISGFVAGVLMYLLNWDYFDTSAYEVNRKSIFTATASLGVVYALIQSFYFWLIDGHLKKNVYSYIITAWAAHALTVFICYTSIRLMLRVT